MPNKNYDVIIIGGGHAAVEGALICARAGLSTLMLALNLDSVALLACNPSIGGTAKGHLVREIDALGGEMGVQADKALIQLRMLNMSKGAAVQSLRAQIDKSAYHRNVKSVLESTPDLYLRQAEVVEILTDNGNVTGVKTMLGQEYYAPAVLAATGVYLKSCIIIGDKFINQGPSGFARAEELSDSIRALGHELRRFKTGTPTRLDGNTVDYTRLERQDGDPSYSFSALSDEVAYNRSPCYLGYTNTDTHDIIRRNIHLAPMYSGLLHSTGARYCPSIEDKIVRFPDRTRHQFFLEPEGLDTVEIYIQGISTSLPVNVQQQIINSIDGLQNTRIMRDAYAIEYDCIDSLTLTPALESKHVSGLFFAGQINGTSGYEEAAAQGLIAGINIIMKHRSLPPFVLARDEAYIGVLVDDLVTKGTQEPYRMMTSRAEFRLNLRQDTADLRLTPKAHALGLITQERLARYNDKRQSIDELTALIDTVYAPAKVAPLFEANGIELPKTGLTLKDLLRRGFSSAELKAGIESLSAFSPELIEIVRGNTVYEGYIARQQRTINDIKKLENIAIPADIDYNKMSGLRIEAQQKLDKIRPLTIGQASRISGVNPSDISVLILKLKTKHKDYQ